MSSSVFDDDSQGKGIRRTCHPQRLTQAVVLASLLGVALTLLWIAAPRLWANDDFAAYAALNVGDTMHEGDLEFDCAALAAVQARLHDADELWTDNVFRVVEFQRADLRRFALKQVHAAPTGKLNAHHKARPALPGPMCSTWNCG